MKAIGYIRVSTEEQAKEGISLDSQTEKIQSICKAKEWNLIEIITDQGVSAKDLKRDGVQKLLKLATAEKFDMLVIYRLDRLTRNIRDMGYLTQDVFDRHDIAFSSIRESFDTSTATGRLMLNLIGSIAQWERETIAERTRDSLRFKKSRLEHYGPVPYGFKCIDGKLIPIEEEIDVVKRILRYRHVQGLSYWRICEDLDMREIRTRRGRQFYPSSVSVIANLLPQLRMLL